MSFYIARGEIIDANTHKYTSTHVSGGGGYVASTSSGVQGYVNPIKSQVIHHVDKDFWIRDFASGLEEQVTLSDSKFCARAGHTVTLLWDGISKRYEYLLNESTGQVVRNGIFNVEWLEACHKAVTYAKILSFMLLVPFLNLLAGLALLAIFALFLPVIRDDKDGKEFKFYVLVSIVCGLVVLVCSYFLYAALNARDGLFGPMLFCGMAMPMTWWSFGKARSLGVGFLKRRMNEHEEALRAAIGAPVLVKG